MSANARSPRSARRGGTLASIAAELGLSVTTVSNAYNRPDQLSAATRNRVFAAARRMGYPGPDPTARSLRTRRAGAIGVLLTEELTYAFEDQASLDFMSGVSVACAELGVSMLLLPAGVDPDATEQDVAALVGQAAVDGFIVYSTAADDPFVDAVLARAVPTVICDQPRHPRRAGFVGIDDYAAIQPAAQAIVDAGHRQVGILCIRLSREPNNGPVTPERLAAAQMDVQRSRVRGALDVLAAAGVDPASVPIIERHINDATTTRDAAEELLDAHPELSAIICTTDSMALGALAAATDRGLRVPEDLSITGFDGIAQAVAAGITTVAQPSKDKGIASGRALAALLADAAPASEILDTAFLPGSTVAAPRR